MAAACSLLPTLFCGAGAGPFAGKHCQYLCMHSEFSGALAYNATCQARIHYCSYPTRTGGIYGDVLLRGTRSRLIFFIHSTQGMHSSGAYSNHWLMYAFAVVLKVSVQVQVQIDIDRSQHHSVCRTQWDSGGQSRYWPSTHSSPLVSGHASPLPPHWEKSDTKLPRPLRARASFGARIACVAACGWLRGAAAGAPICAASANSRAVGRPGPGAGAGEFCGRQCQYLQEQQCHTEVPRGCFHTFSGNLAGHGNNPHCHFENASHKLWDLS